MIMPLSVNQVNNTTLDKTTLAKYIMNRFQNFPVFDKEKVGLLQEVFRHPEFVNGTPDQQKMIMLKSSQSKYEDELKFPIDKYFGFHLKPMLQNKSILDLGCLVGGRSVAWFEQYNLKNLSGIDVDQVYINAAKQFAETKNINADFKKGYGEKIPYQDNQFDAILTYDVFEHVQDLDATLKECYRVLKPEGKLLAIFPSYYHPREHHLGLVSNFPGLHYIFSGKTLVRAYYEILQERGERAYWYKRNSPQLADYEKGNTINGTTFRKFYTYIKNSNWKIVFQSHKPIGSVGRIIEKHKWLKVITVVLIPLTYIPIIQDFVLQRITVILEKKR